MEGKADELHLNVIPWSNAFWPALTPFCPPMWQAEADTELTLSASPTTAVGQKALALAKRRYSTVIIFEGNAERTANFKLLEDPSFE